MNCETCCWASPTVIMSEQYPEGEEPTLVLECWRYPPQLVWDGEGATQVRPQVSGDDWCGEWEERDDG